MNLFADFHVPAEYLTNIYVRDKVCIKKMFLTFNLETVLIM